MAEPAQHPAPDDQRAPDLTLPPEAAEVVRAAYAAAGVILEYGSGGSTVIAAQLPGRSVFAVESDRDWLDGMADWFEANPPAARVVLHHADIGRTGKWGMPQGNGAWTRFHHYPTSVWDRSDFLHPDVVLIDGRFRAACFLTTLYRITRPVTVLWDDYTDRPAYHTVERLVTPAAFHGRMARFDLTPTTMAGADLPWVIEQFTRKQ